MKKILEEIWTQQIAAAYERGSLCSERQLQAECYFHLKNRLPEHQVWVEPLFVLINKDGSKTKVIPDLVITKDLTIESIIELKYKPFGEAHVLGDMKKLKGLAGYKGGEGFRLKTDPWKGEYTNDFYSISENLLCVYAAVARGNHAYAVKNPRFWKEKSYYTDLPQNFLHLVGRVYPTPGMKYEFLNATDE